MKTGTSPSSFFKITTHVQFILLCCVIGCMSSHQTYAINWSAATKVLNATWSTMTKQNILFAAKRALTVGTIAGVAYLIARNYVSRCDKRLSKDLNRPISKSLIPGLKLYVDTDAKVKVIGHDKKTIEIDHQYGASWNSDLHQITYSSDFNENTKQITVRGLINTYNHSLWQRLLAKLFLFTPQRKLTHIIRVPYTTTVEVVTRNSYDYTHKHCHAIQTDHIVGPININTYEGGASTEHVGDSDYYKPKKKCAAPAQLHNPISIFAPKAFGPEGVKVSNAPGDLTLTAPLQTISYTLLASCNNGYIVDKHQPDGSPTKVFQVVNPSSAIQAYLEYIKQNGQTSQPDAKTDPLASQGALEYAKAVDDAIKAAKPDVHKNVPVDPTKIRGNVTIYDTQKLPDDCYDTIGGKRYLNSKGQEALKKPESLKTSDNCPAYYQTVDGKFCLSQKGKDDLKMPESFTMTFHPPQPVKKE